MSARAIILDSSVVLAEVLKEREWASRLSKMRKEVQQSAIGVLITPTVKEECDSKIVKVFAELSVVLKDFRTYILQAKGDKGFGNYDLMVDQADLALVQDFFRSRLLIARKKGDRERLRRMEEFVSGKIEGATGDVSLKALIAEAHGDLVRMDAEHTTGVGAYEQKVILHDASPQEVKDLGKKIKLKNRNDLKILIESSKYHRIDNPRSVFVTIDYVELMQRSKEIEVELGLKCVDPYFAVNIVIHL